VPTKPAETSERLIREAEHARWLATQFPGDELVDRLREYAREPEIKSRAYVPLPPRRLIAPLELGWFSVFYWPHHALKGSMKLASPERTLSRRTEYHRRAGSSAPVRHFPLRARNPGVD